MTGRTQDLSELRPEFWVGFAGPYDTFENALKFSEVVTGHEKVYACCSGCKEVVNPDNFGAHINASHVVWRG